MSSVVSLRELRQDAFDLVRRVEAGEEITVAVHGRPCVRLVAVAPRRWRRWDDLAELFGGPVDDRWGVDRDEINQTFEGPWSRG